MAAPIVDAYADSLGSVFLCAVPVAIIGFVVSLFLREVPLREMDAASAHAGLVSRSSRPTGGSHAGESPSCDAA